MDTYAWCQLYIQPADYFRHKGRRGLIGHKAGHPVIITELQKVLIRFLAAAEYKAGDLAGCEFIIHQALAFLVHGINICLLNVSDDLNPFPVKMVEKPGELQGRTVYVRVRQHDLVRINIRSGVAKLHFLNQFRYGYSMHGNTPLSWLCFYFNSYHTIIL